MKTPQEVLNELRSVCSDERLSYKPANVFVNAPLALVQTELESRRRTLQWVLDISNKIPNPETISRKVSSEKKTRGKKV